MKIRDVGEIAILVLLIVLVIMLGTHGCHAQVPLQPNSTAVCSTTQTCVITSVSNHAATAQFGNGSSFTTAGVPTLPLPVQPGALGADPSPGSAESIYFQQTTVAYTVQYTLAGGTPWTVVIPGLAVAVNPCTATNVNWWGIGGGTVGESAVLPAGTVYKVAAGPCTVAATSTTVDLSVGNLAVQQTNAVQQISVSNSSGTNVVVVPAIAGAKCFVVTVVTFVVTPTGGSSTTYSSGLVSPVTVCP